MVREVAGLADLNLVGKLAFFEFVVTILALAFI